jgi:hypothetical protein
MVEDSDKGTKAFVDALKNCDGCQFGPRPFGSQIVSAQPTLFTSHG